MDDVHICSVDHKVIPYLFLPTKKQKIKLKPGFKFIYRIFYAELK